MVEFQALGAKDRGHGDHLFGMVHPHHRQIFGSIHPAARQLLQHGLRVHGVTLVRAHDVQQDVQLGHAHIAFTFGTGSNDWPDVQLGQQPLQHVGRGLAADAVPSPAEKTRHGSQAVGLGLFQACQVDVRRQQAAEQVRVAQQHDGAIA